jgi:hypothetical protein
MTSHGRSSASSWGVRRRRLVAGEHDGEARVDELVGTGRRPGTGRSPARPPRRRLVLVRERRPLDVRGEVGEHLVVVRPLGDRGAEHGGERQGRDPHQLGPGRPHPGLVDQHLADVEHDHGRGRGRLEPRGWSRPVRVPRGHLAAWSASRSASATSRSHRSGTRSRPRRRERHQRGARHARAGVELEEPRWPPASTIRSARDRCRAPIAS